jgi:hypothetical protein
VCGSSVALSYCDAPAMCRAVVGACVNTLIVTQVTPVKSDYYYACHGAGSRTKAVVATLLDSVDTNPLYLTHSAADPGGAREHPGGPLPGPRGRVPGPRVPRAGLLPVPGGLQEVLRCR